MKANGLKTRVKEGELTSEEALAWLKEKNKDTPYLTPHRTIRWLNMQKS